MIVEDEEKDKKRLIHDATYGVRVNHRIKCRDKLRAPKLGTQASAGSHGVFSSGHFSCGLKTCGVRGSGSRMPTESPISACSRKFLSGSSAA